MTPEVTKLARLFKWTSTALALTVLLAIALWYFHA